MLLIDSGFDYTKVYDCDNGEVLVLKGYNCIGEIVKSIESLLVSNRLRGTMRDYTVCVGVAGIDYAIGKELEHLGLPVKWMNDKVIVKGGK